MREQEVHKIAKVGEEPVPQLFSPGQIEEIKDDPEKMQEYARAMGVVNLDNLFRAMQDPTINPSTRIEFQKMLNKMGKLEPDAKVDPLSGGPQVVINITRAKDQDAGITIEGAANALPAEA